MCVCCVCVCLGFPAPAVKLPESQTLLVIPAVNILGGGDTVDCCFQCTLTECPQDVYMWVCTYVGGVWLYACSWSCSSREKTHKKTWVCGGGPLNENRLVCGFFFSFLHTMLCDGTLCKCFCPCVFDGFKTARRCLALSSADEARKQAVVLEWKREKKVGEHNDIQLFRLSRSSKLLPLTPKPQKHFSDFFFFFFKNAV